MKFSSGFGGYQDESSDNDEVINQLKRLYPIDSSVVNDDFHKDLETFLDQWYITNMDTSYESQDRGNSVEDQMSSSTMNHFESDYL